MSLILEALKKSEARRQLGEAPGLGTPFAVTRRRRSPLPVIVVLVLIAAAFGWYYLRTMPAHPAAGAATAAKSPGADTVTGKPSAQAAAPPAFPATANRFTAPATTPRAPMPGEASRQGSSAFAAPGQIVRGGDPRVHDPRVNPPATAGNFAAVDGVARRAERQNRGATNNATATPAGVGADAGLAQPRNPASTAAAQPAGQAPMSAAPAATTPAARTDVAALAQKPALAPPLPPAPAAPPQPVAASPTTATPSDVPLYYELPFNVRKDLPTLTVSMHVYAAVPAQRFVVVDGERKAEGESIKEGLTLREIRSDGIVLEFRGQKFFYPRPGR